MVHHNVHAPATVSCPKPNIVNALLSYGYNYVQRKVAVLRQQYEVLIYDLRDKCRLSEHQSMWRASTQQLPYFKSSNWPRYNPR